MKKVKPRWKPTYGEDTVNVFLGCAGDLDVWWGSDVADEVYIVGPESRLIRPDGRCNFDAFDIVDGNLTPRAGSQDLHIDVHDMCQIYALCFEHKLFKENTNAPG